jgi:hypothetical protein
MFLLHEPETIALNLRVATSVLIAQVPGRRWRCATQSSCLG